MIIFWNGIVNFLCLIRHNPFYLDFSFGVITFLMMPSTFADYLMSNGFDNV